MADLGSLGSIVTFILIHVAFGIVSKFLTKWISFVFYLLLVTLFLVYYYQVSLGDVIGVTSAVVAQVGSFVP